MNISETTELMKKYSTCPECGNDRIGGTPSKGSLIIEEEIFKRGCSCGWEVTVDRRIKHVATLTKKKGGKMISGIYEVKIHGQLNHKLLPLIELKKRAGVKRIDQHQKILEYLNGPEGRKWAIEVKNEVV